MERTRQEEREKYLSDKKTVEEKMKEKQVEIKKLKQKRAIQAKAEAKISHYKRLQNFIQTETKPRICFLPAKHTIRSMELLKNSARNMEGACIAVEIHIMIYFQCSSKNGRTT